MIQSAASQGHMSLSEARRLRRRIKKERPLLLGTVYTGRWHMVRILLPEGGEVFFNNATEYGAWATERDAR